MQTPERWLTVFGERQEQAKSPGLYWVALLSLLLGTVTLLWSLPVPDEFRLVSPMLNWGSAFLMASLVYYFIISLTLGLGMVPFILGMGVLAGWLSGLDYPLPYPATVMIGIGVGGLCFGHYASGGVRAVIADVQLVMIAPLWLLSNIYRRVGIPI